MTLDVTVEAWARAFIGTADFAEKYQPAAPPDLNSEQAWTSEAHTTVPSSPGRPSVLRLTPRSPRTPKPGALRSSEARARLLHAFLHHELQAAELFAWAILAFPETPRAFRSGLLRLCLEELEHLQLYRSHLEHLGHAIGDFPVRDWFWERVPACATPQAFVAFQGLGLEAANLEHSQRFAKGFRDAGDEAGALILEQVEREEIAHVAFAAKWFARFCDTNQDPNSAAASGVNYTLWKASLPAPLTPALLQGRPLNREARRKAGLSEDFLDQLVQEPSTTVSREARGGAQSSQSED